jgi:hypothetical protein
MTGSSERKAEVAKIDEVCFAAFNDTLKCVRCWAIRGQFGYRKLLYYKGFPGMSTPVFMVSVCSSVKIKGRDCGTINGHDESASMDWPLYFHTLFNT